MVSEPNILERLGLGGGRLADERLVGDTLARDCLAGGCLSGQVAVITGAGRGIGREIARTFARLGAHVMIAEISDEGSETERLIRSEGGSAIFVRTDVSSEPEVAHLAGRTHEAFGLTDILINNAILCPVASVMEMDAALWDRVIAVNLRGAFLTCKAFLPAMLARKHGTIVNMISTDAMPHLSAYIATKQGLAGFSQSLAAEVGEEGVRVIAFGPGFVDTPGLRGAGVELAPRLGLTPEQFQKVSVHPAYQGMMPAEHAAAATAYLVAALADDYHGELVTGYTILERAGLITADRAGVIVAGWAGSSEGSGSSETPDSGGAPGSGEGTGSGEGSGSSETPDSGGAPGSGEGPGSTEAADHGEAPGSLTAAALNGDAESLSAAGAGRTEAFGEAVRLSDRLREIIAQTDSEFNKLPIFIRPLARGGFKSKTGQSIHDWTRTVSGLSEQLKVLQAQGRTVGMHQKVIEMQQEAIENQQKAIENQQEAKETQQKAIERAFWSGYPRLKELLGKLISYYMSVPGDMERFVRDPAVLQDVKRTMSERTELILSLIKALDRLQA